MLRYQLAGTLWDGTVGALIGAVMLGSFGGLFVGGEGLANGALMGGAYGAVAGLGLAAVYGRAVLWAELLAFLHLLRAR